MSNLLERSSLVLTPTAYNNGEALCIKPDDASGDFQFSRNSAATRVNAQGLVENVQILSSNLVQNPSFSEEGVQEVSNGSFSQEGSEELANSDFTNGLTSWNGSGYTVVNNQLIANSTGLFYQPLALTANKTYKAEINIESISQGGVKFYCQGNQSATITTSGVHTIYIVSGSSNSLVGINPQGTFEAVVNSISFREVGQDWVLTSGAAIGENKLDINANAYDYFARQLDVSTIGKTYKVSVDAEIQSGRMILYLADTNAFEVIDTSGSYTFYIVADGTQIRFRAFDTALIGSITNISVKEVGQNWTLGTGWEIGNSVATKSGPDLSYLTQSSLTSVVGKTYNVKASITNVTTGNVRIDNFTSGTTYTSDTEVDVIYTATTAGAFRFLGWSGFDGTITNISVLEITDDTNLPRINYEGFSYQDALGSELVTNGDFATDSDWVKGLGWSIGGGTANGLATLDPIRQSISGFTTGKKYKVSFEITEVTNGFIRVYSYVGASGTFTKVLETPSQIGTYEVIFEFGGTNKNLMFYGSVGNGNFTGSIDNVSVKEYLGQEVVPDSGCGSWLFESQSTNLVTQSELFSDASWNKTQTVIEAASITLPNGLTNGFKLFANTTGGTNHWLEKSPFPTATTGQDYTLSLFVKSAGSDFIQIASSSGFPSKYQNFNISTGTKASGDISDSSITDFGNGWFRISVTETTTGTTARYLIVPILSDVGRNAQFAGNADEDGVYIWGAQLEEQSYATSYIPTEGATVTRNQDLCTNGGSLATINSTEGVLYAEIAALANDLSFRSIALSDGTVNNRILILYTDASNGIRVLVFRNNALQVILNNTINITDVNKVAVRYKFNNVTFWVNGVKLSTDTNASMPIGLNQLSFSRGDGDLPFFGKTKCLAVFPYLTDQELTELTTI